MTYPTYSNEPAVQAEIEAHLAQMAEVRDGQAARRDLMSNGRTVVLVVKDDVTCDVTVNDPA